MAAAKATLVLGASMNPERYSNKAIRSLRANGHPVVAVGLREGMVDDVALHKVLPEGTKVDTVTLYLNAHNQEVWSEQVLALHPRRIIFNPGAENPVLARAAEAAGIEVMEACTLVLLNIGAF